MGHISSDCHKQQNVLMGTFRGKEIMSEHEIEEKFDGDGKCVRCDDDREDELLGNGVKTLMD